MRERARHAEIRAVQLDETLRLAKFTAIPQIMVAVAFAAFFWHTTDRPYVLCLLAAVAAPAITAITAALIWQGKPLSMAAVEFGHKGAAALALVTGAAWSSMPSSLFSDQHEALICATVAGLVSIVYVLGPIMAASLFFALPIVIATFCTLLIYGGPDGGAIALLLIIYASFTVVCRTLMNELSLQHIIDRINVGEQHETIRMLLRDFEENASDWLWETDEAGLLAHIPQRLIEASGLPEDSIGRGFDAVLSRGTECDYPGADAVLAAMRDRKAFIDEVVEVGDSNAPVWWKLTGKPIYDARGFVGFRGVGTDVTAARNAELRIAFMAEHDHLTGLANRISFQAQAAADCVKLLARGGMAALLYVDLDGFKHANDTFGHVAGDELLRCAASRIHALAGPESFTARFGGDEFAVWLPAANMADVCAWASNLIASLSVPFTVDGRSLTIGCSIGIALVPDHGTELDDLYLKADMALYRAKSEGKGRYLVFDEQIENALITQRTLEGDLAIALARREFELYYQPILDLQNGRVSCFEALVRWRSPTHGFVQPGDFIPLAESCGLIVDLGRWILQEACREAAGWPEGVRVAVNVSPRQLRSPGFLQDVEIALERSGLSTGRLEIEITEGIFMDTAPTSVDTINELRKKGIRVAIDDFGTGFSSLSYLVRFPVDKIKIDKSFVSGLEACGESQAVVEAILVLASRLGISVTAEGVETLEQAIDLKSHGCGSIQGYLLSPPRPRAEVAALLANVPDQFRAMVPDDLTTGKLAPVRWLDKSEHARGSESSHAA